MNNLKPISEDLKQEKTVLHNSTKIQKTLKRIKHKLIPILLIASLAGCSKKEPLQEDDQVEETTPEPATPATDAERAKEIFNHMRTVCKAHGLIDNGDIKARQNFLRIFIIDEKLGLFELCAKSESDDQGQTDQEQIGRWVKKENYSYTEYEKFRILRLNDGYVNSEGKEVRTVTIIQELKDKNLYNEVESAQTAEFMFPGGILAKTKNGFISYQGETPIYYASRVIIIGGGGKVPKNPENKNREHTIKSNKSQNANTDQNTNANTNQKPTKADLNAEAQENATR